MISLIISVVMAGEIKIVSFSPGATETLFDLGLGKFIVGTSERSNYPNEAKSIQTVGAYLNPNVEKVLSLKPNFIVTEKAYKKAFFEKLGIKMIVITSKSIDDYKKNILILKEHFPESKHKQVLSEWESYVRDLQKFKQKKRGIIQVSDRPRMLAGKNTILDNLLSKCGLENAVNFNGYKRVSKEYIYKLDVLKIDISHDKKNNPKTKKINPDNVSRLTLSVIKNLYKTCLEVMN